ncbi:MAG: mercury(II) reductase [Candidatus Nanopelagicales bacterium]|nr:mercury(II) reductase [Candidatus Nanopelagicales bacterium]MDZ4249191.1 mercury(II) reductase [Candidatus Nanopelagicales bacterium]
MGFDLAIVGSGSAAFAAAITARRAGRSVVMIESGIVGGTCVNTGCVPSKALLAAAAARHDAAEAGRFPGITAGAASVDLDELMTGKAALVEQLRATKYADVAAYHGWEVISGQARFAAGPRLLVDVRGGDQIEIEARAYLIATGASSWIPPIRGLDETGFLTSTTAMDLEELPDSLLVIGGNAVGLEQAQLFARLGSKVTVVEARDRLAPFAEPEVSEAIGQALTDEGIAISTATTVRRAQNDDGLIGATLSGECTDRLAVRQILVATGRLPNTSLLNLDSVGVDVGARGGVVVDECLRTTNPVIWAAGDVTGGAQFVYVAAAQGELAAGNAFGESADRIDYRYLPQVMFTSPAVASVGLTEAQARQEGLEVDVRLLPMSLVPRAIVNRDSRGVLKMVAEAATGRLLGVHMVSDSAGDVIAAATLALRARMSVSELAGTWSPYLTTAEALKLAAQAFTGDVTKLSCCAV